MQLTKQLGRRWIGLGMIVALLAITLPTRAQNPTTIESDNAQVARAGNWTAQTASAASGGSYLYSSGSEADVLTLEFSGTALEILYIAGPQLGTLAIEVDDTVLRTVITTEAETRYGQSTIVNYLPDGPHTLKVYAQAGGIIAVDAFAIPLVAPSRAMTEGVASVGTQESTATCPPPNSTFSLTPVDTGSTMGWASFSQDGRYITFNTASALVPQDTNNVTDVYIFDREACTYTRASITTTGGQGYSHSYSNAHSMSADGHYVAFESDALLGPSYGDGIYTDIYLYDRVLNKTTLITWFGNNYSYGPAISDDGRYISFYSMASNQVPNDTNGKQDAFLYDRQAGSMIRANQVNGSAQPNDHSGAVIISGNGDYLLFNSSASNIVSNDTNGKADVFLRTNFANALFRVSGIFVQGNDQSHLGDISSNGRFLVMSSAATNLVAYDSNGKTDIFWIDMDKLETRLITQDHYGIGGNGASGYPVISGDGRYVAFESVASNLVSNDTNNAKDVFVYDSRYQYIQRVSLDSAGNQINGPSELASISPDGQWVSFGSTVNNIVPGDTDGAKDIFITPRATYKGTDQLAVFNSAFHAYTLLATLADNPIPSNFDFYSAQPDMNATNGQWVMGDWNNDGQDTPGVLADGQFYWTNNLTNPPVWDSVPFDTDGQVVVGRFKATPFNDCIGRVEMILVLRQPVFTLHYACNFSGNPTAEIFSQSLEGAIPEMADFNLGFAAGDFDGDGLDTLAAYDDHYVFYGNTPITQNGGIMDLMQSFGKPSETETPTFLSGDWDGDGIDSFGVFYPSGEFFYRNDLLTNAAQHGNQTVGLPFGPTAVQASTWR